MKTCLNVSIVALSAVLAGCGGVRLADSVDLTFDWNILTGPSNELHTPYVAGADFRVFTTGVDREATAGWTLESSDPSVLALGPTAEGRADASALAPGRAVLTVLDERDRPLHSAAVDVRQPDRAELLAHGPLILGRPELQEDWDEIRVVVGGSATFEVEWFEGNTRLHGHGALSATTTGDVTVEPRRTFLFEDREWVTFTPRSEGTHEVTLRANGQAVRTVRIVAVDESELDRVELYGMDESRARRGQLLTVLAQGYDAEGRALFGVEYQWTLDGDLEGGFGDLYRYEFVPGEYHMLEAFHGAAANQVRIQGEEGFVDSTNRLGCTIVGVGLPSGGAWIAVALLGLVVLRRRR
jgi:hypothetical protein